jgi:hypothetical protein
LQMIMERSGRGLLRNFFEAFEESHTKSLSWQPVSLPGIETATSWVQVHNDAAAPANSVLMAENLKCTMVAPPVAKSHNSSSDGPDVTGRQARLQDATISVYLLDNNGNVHSNGERILLLPTDTALHSLHLQISYSRESVVIFRMRFNVLTEVNGGTR